MSSVSENYTNEEKWDFVNPPNIRSYPITRKRAIGGGNYTCKEYRKHYSTDQSLSGYPVGKQMGFDTYDLDAKFKLTGTQITTSEGHPFRNNPATGKSDIGGDFFTQKQYTTIGGYQNIHITTYDPAHGQRIESYYKGPMMAIDPTVNRYPSSSISNSTQLNAKGTTAIARTKPTNPVGGLTTALVELRRDGLPHLFGSSLWEGKASVVRNAGDEYLNKEFGWDPLAKDVSDFLGIVTNANDVIERYKRGIGKPMRRRFDFTTTETTTELDLGMHFPFQGGYDASKLDGYAQTPYILHQNSGAQTGRLTSTVKVWQRCWFSGAFTYYFPEKYRGKLGDLAVLAHELGLDLSPETLWAAAPWSWAIDWFSNAGDVISNYSSFHNDGLVMTYGYIMEHTIVSNTYRLTGATLNNGSPAPVSDVSYVIETKQRRGATPYGFGLSFGALSAFQKSIIGALGLTKLFR